MTGPYLSTPPPMMTATQQLQSAQLQLDVVSRSLDGVTWAIHPLDLEELRTAIGQNTHMASLPFTVAADPGLEGRGPRMLWPGEWPESWGTRP
jgi:hypothetical protein